MITQPTPERGIRVIEIKDGYDNDKSGERDYGLLVTHTLHGQDPRTGFHSLYLHSPDLDEQQKYARTIMEGFETGVLPPGMAFALLASRLAVTNKDYLDDE
jgi:hypothetical protein